MSFMCIFWFLGVYKSLVLSIGVFQLFVQHFPYTYSTVNSSFFCIAYVQHTQC
jgi:hypothetical protein